MATQLIRCTWSLLKAIDEASRRETYNNCQPKVTLELLSDGKRYSGIAVLVHDDRLAWDNWPCDHDRVFTLLLASDNKLDKDYEPRHLPDDLVKEAIQAFATQVTLDDGHAGMELFAILSAAMEAPNHLPLPSDRRLPRSAFERRLVDTAWRLQADWKPQGQEISSKLAVYGDALLRTGLGSVIESLSTECAVADGVHLVPNGGSNRFRTRRHDSEYLTGIDEKMRRSRAIREGMWWVLQELNPYGAGRRGRLSALHIGDFYRHAFSAMIDDGAPCSHHPDSHTMHPLYSTEAIGCNPGTRRLARAFDRRLLSGIDPIIIAALALFEHLSIWPLTRSHRQVGEHLSYLLLREAHLPPMPPAWARSTMATRRPRNPNRDRNKAARSHSRSSPGRGFGSGDSRTIYDKRTARTACPCS